MTDESTDDPTPFPAAQLSVAVLGTGGMGLGMAMRLADLGVPLAVYNRTAARAQPAVDLGAMAAATPAAAAADADIVILSLSDADAVTSVLSGTSGVLDGIRPGSIVVDLSTTSSRFARQLADDLAVRSIDVIDACVVGNPMHARSGALRILVAGETAVVERARPVLGQLGKDVVFLGATGNASTMKLALNLLMGAQMTALAEAVTLAHACGIEPSAYLDVIASSGYASPMMAFRCALIANGAYMPAMFRLTLMAKDLDLAIDEAARWAVQMPTTKLAAEIHRDAVDRGYGELDAAALVAVAGDAAGLGSFPPPMSSGSTSAPPPSSHPSSPTSSTDGSAS